MSRAPRDRNRGGTRSARRVELAARAVAAVALAWLVDASSAGAEPPAAAPDERTVCEWVVEPRYVGGGAPKLEPQRVCRTETVQRPAAPTPPTDLRPADGGRGTGILVESEPAKPAPP